VSPAIALRHSARPQNAPLVTLARGFPSAVFDIQTTGAPPAGAEGYVPAHAGLHGSGDFSAARRGWRHPTARVVVRRIL